MKRVMLSIGVAAAIAAVTPAAHAAQGDGDWYVSGFAGGSFLEGATNTGDDTALHLNSSTDPGFGLRAAIGTYRAPQVRLEGEISYIQAGFSNLSVTNDGGLGAAAGRASLNGASGSARGALSSLGFLANAYYDYDTGGPWRPYIGAGAGFARVAADGVALAGVPVVNDADIVFAYQFSIGIGYEISRNVTVAADYRYFATLDPVFRDAAGGHFSSEFASHTLSVGVRYRF